MSGEIRVTSPLDEATIDRLRAGDNVLISGIMYAARDAAHRRMNQAIEADQPLPFDIKGQTIYYMGLSPAPPGRVIGAAGPTTAGRMDVYTPALLERGLRAMLGKGDRSPAVRESIRKQRAVYLVATGGAGALLSKAIIGSEVVAYPELGAEAVRRLEVVDFPATVALDAHGGDLFEAARLKYGGMK